MYKQIEQFLFGGVYFIILVNYEDLRGWRDLLYGHGCSFIDG